MMKSIIFIILLFPILAFAQRDEIPQVGTFQAGVIFGFNAAQVHGDKLAGYNKLGFTAGGRVTTRFKDSWEAGIELLYSQKGSRTSLGDLNFGIPETNISLNYAEIPLFVSFVDNGIRINAGLSYNRLVDLNLIVSSIDETDNRSEFYKKSDIIAFASGSYQINDHWIAEVRWGRSFISIVKLSDLTPTWQFNVLLSFRGLYMF